MPQYFLPNGGYRWMPGYPLYQFFPRSKPPPIWTKGLVQSFAEERKVLDTRTALHKESDEVLAILKPHLEALDFRVESGKRKADKLNRPVSFGEMGEPALYYEIDAFNEEHGIVLEVEAGRSIEGNAIYKDLVRTALMVDAKFAVIAMPLEYKSKGRLTPAYRKGVGILDAIYSSGRLKLPFDGVLLVGY